MTAQSIAQFARELAEADAEHFRQNELTTADKSPKTRHRSEQRRNAAIRHAEERLAK